MGYQSFKNNEIRKFIIAILLKASAFALNWCSIDVD